MGTASFLVMFAVMCGFVALVLQKAKGNNEQVFKQAVERTAFMEADRDRLVIETNANLLDLQEQYNRHLAALHQENLALKEVIKKHGLTV